MYHKHLTTLALALGLVVYAGASYGNLPPGEPCDNYDHRPKADVSGSATICKGDATTIQAALTGHGQWIVTWSDGVITTNNSSPATRSVSPSATTTYTVTALRDHDCAARSGDLSGSAVVTVQPGQLAVIEDSLGFGAVVTGATAQASFTVTNTGCGQLTGSVAVSDGPFTVSGGSSFTVAGYGTAKVDITFAPTEEGWFTNEVVFTSDGGTSTKTVAGQGAIVPVAGFSASTTSGEVSLTVAFTDSSSGTITNRYWDFGDGETVNTTDTTLSHTYTVAATNTVQLIVSGPVGESTITQSNYIVVVCAVPSTPSDLTATTISTNQINLSWGASVNGCGTGSAEGYNVYRDSALIATTTSTSYSDSGLIAGTEYCYKVEAYDGVRVSVSSADTCADAFVKAGSLFGNYNGLVIQAAAPSHASSGSVKLKVGKAGAFVAKLNMGGVKTVFKGQFDAAGNANDTVTRKGSDALQVSLHLDVANGTEQITGTVSNSVTGVFVSDLLADRAVSSTTASSLVGSYKVVLEPSVSDDATNVPQGYGYGTLAVTKKGIGALSGMLGDGTKITRRARVSKYATWPLYDTLYGKQGASVGWVTFVATNSTVDATVDWFRPTNSTSAYYPDGFTTNVTLVGEKYVVPGAGGTTAAGDRQVTLSGGNLASNIVHAITVDTKGNVTVSTPNDENLKMKLNPATGAFSGSFTHPVLSKTITFNGLVLQTDGPGAGYFLGSSESGYVLVETP